jgi:hypothetical protein
MLIDLSICAINKSSSFRRRYTVFYWMDRYRTNLYEKEEKRKFAGFLTHTHFTTCFFQVSTVPVHISCWHSEDRIVETHDPSLPF